MGVRGQAAAADSLSFTRCLVAYGFRAAGWSEFDQPDDVYWFEGQAIDETDPDPFATIPDNVTPDIVEGIWVHVYGMEGDEGDEHWFWVRTYTPLDSWDKWHDLIALTMDMCDMALA